LFTLHIVKIVLFLGGVQQFKLSLTCWSQKKNCDA